jgi:hypothetical protein
MTSAFIFDAPSRGEGSGERDATEFSIRPANIGGFDAITGLHLVRGKR